MKPVDVPSFGAVSTITRQYRAFRGVDYATDESQIDASRSPSSINMISDAGGYPQKRLGWRTVHTLSGRINGIYPFKENDEIQMIVHAGTEICKVVGDAVTQLKTGVTNQSSTAFYFDARLYILTGGEYLVYDGESVQAVADSAYTPTTTYGAKPAGGGTQYESVNLLNPWRYNKFCADGTSTVYQLDVTGIDELGEVRVNGNLVTGCTVNLSTGKVTFPSAPAKPLSDGLDNVEIKFRKGDGDSGFIAKCTIATTYGVGSDNRVFVSGNPDRPATEYYSGLDDPSYIPDTNYVTVGSSDWAIMNYLKFQGELLVIKEDNRQEPVVWHHTADLLNGQAVFPLKQGVMGSGSVSKRASQSLLDDPMFLSPRGVFAPVNTFTLTTQSRGVKCRSKRINPRLTLEPNLANAVSTVWDGYYIIAVDDHAYIADSNQNRSDDGYEWYYWDHIPAICFGVEARHLWFGTADGRLCRFNDDILDKDGTISIDAYNDDGEPIEWLWATKLDDFGNLGVYKNLTKRGCVIQFKTFRNSGCDIYVRTEKDEGVFKRREVLDRFDFNYIDFSRFSFNTLQSNARSLRTKVKKFQQLQIILKGNALNEGFGVLEIVLRATVGNPVK